MRCWLISTSLILGTFVVTAQKIGQKTLANISADSIRQERLFSYFLNLQAGELIECKDCSEKQMLNFTTYIIQGVHIGKKLQMGIGVGLDVYTDWKVMPVFISTSWDVIGNKNTNALFVQLNYGWSRPWLKKSAQDYNFDHTAGGKMTNAMIGYRLRLRDFQLSFSAGTKYQEVFTYDKYQSYHLSPDGRMIQGPDNITEIEQRMNRVLIVIGFHF